MSQEDFEFYKQRAWALAEEGIPSRTGCLNRLAGEGHVGPLVEAAVEAVFNERQEARAQAGEESGGGFLGKLVILLILAGAAAVAYAVFS